MLVDKELPNRKQNRQTAHDYRANGVYFVTVVTVQRLELLGKIKNDCMALSDVGKVAADCIEKIEMIYPSVIVAASVVMPNHVHMLLQLLDEKKNPSVARIVQQWKGAVSKQAGYSLWQDRFHDNIVLTAKEYRTIKTYIKLNPTKWAEDRFHPPLAEL